MMRDDAPPLILASGSATRRALLERAGLRFAVKVPRVDEAALKEGAQAEGLTAGEAAILLADAKAARIARRHPDAVVLGADQILVCEGRWFDKPEGMDGARAHLRALRGRAHDLATAVVAWRGEARLWHHLATPRLTMREVRDEALDALLALEGEAVLGSVGAYRYEGPGVHLFRAVQGEHAAILGLPLLPLLAWLRDFGVVLR
ncbi:MAG: Maf family protein [Acetobacteraceae bacterium]|nr:Maf family protein [Acetobacteraceae bacterium]